MWRNVLGLALIILLAAGLVIGVRSEPPKTTQTRARDETVNAASPPTLRVALRGVPAEPGDERDLAGLCAELTSSDTVTAAAAIEHLRARFAELSLVQLLDIAFLPEMKGDAEALRQRALKKLKRAKKGLRPIVPAVLTAIAGDDAHHRSVATTILAAHYGRRARLHFDRFLQPQDLPAVRHALTSDVTSLWAKRSLLMAMDELGPEAVSLIPLLRRFLEEERMDIQRTREAQWKAGIIVTGGGLGSGVSLSFMLADVGAPAVPALIALLAEPGRGMGTMASAALEWMGAPAAPALIEALGSSDPLVRRRAAGALKGVKTAPANVTEALERARGDEDPEVREAVAGTLAALTSASVEHLVAQLRSEDSGVRWTTVQEMDRVLEPPFDAEVVDAVLALAPEFARTPETSWYYYANVLEKIGAPAAPAVPYLLRHLLRHQSTAQNRRTMTPRPGDIFRAIGEPAAVHIARALTGSDAALATVAAAALAALDSVDAESRRILAAYLDAHPDSPHAIVIAGALVGAQGNDSALPLLVRALQEGRDWDRRSQAAAGIGRLGRAGLPYLRDLADLLVSLDAEFLRRHDAGGWWSVGITYEVRVDTAIRAVGVHDLAGVVDWLNHPTSGDLQQVARETLEQDVRSRDLLLDAWPRLNARGRWHALKALKPLRTDGPAAAKLIDLGLGDTDTHVRLMAISLAPAEGPRLARAIEVGVAMALGADERTAASALFELGQLRDSAAVLAALRPHAQHADPKVRARIRALLDEIEDGR